MKNIGEKLQQARNAKGISLKEVADYTKIKEEFIVAMENNDFSMSATKRVLNNKSRGG